MAWPVIAAMAAAGLVKGLGDEKKAKADRKREAEIARYSPWTGLGPSAVKEADIMGSVMQGGMGGAMMGQSMGGMGGGGAAAAPAGGAALTSDPSAAASLTGGQSQMGQMGGQDPAMLQKYPWLGMQQG